MIDLHTHTTASDGRCAPVELVARARAADVTVLSVTDHDTVAGCGEAQAACERAGIEFVPGIEVTAVREEVDVHLLGYFVDPQSPSLLRFLAEQRQRRVDRIARMIRRLAELGIVLDGDAILRPALEKAGTSVGRPWIARALVAGGYVADTNEAFAKWLGRGRPAFVAREGAPPADVVSQIHAAGGIASMAHPGLVRRDDWIPGFAASGLDALEAFHSDHDEETTGRYRAMAANLGLAVSGGSDYHADESHGATQPGSVSLPRAEYERLVGLRSRPTGARG